MFQNSMFGYHKCHLDILFEKVLQLEIQEIEKFFGVSTVKSKFSDF